MFVCCGYLTGNHLAEIWAIVYLSLTTPLLFAVYLFNVSVWEAPSPLRQ